MIEKVGKETIKCGFCGESEKRCFCKLTAKNAVVASSYKDFEFARKVQLLFKQLTLTHIT
jgi:hypothetical protein